MMLGATTLATTEFAALAGGIPPSPTICYPTSALVIRLTADSGASATRSSGTTSATVTRSDGTTSATISRSLTNATVTRSTTSASNGPTFP